MTETLPTLRALHEGMVASLQAAYRERVETVAAYDPWALPEPPALVADPVTVARRPLATPAILIEVEAIEPGEDDGSDRQPLRLVLAAHCVLSLRTAEVQLELREFAADVLAHVHGNRWGSPGAVREPMALSAAPAEAWPAVAGWDTWRVSWEQLVYVGADAWAGVGSVPDDVSVRVSGDAFEVLWR